MPAFIAPQLVDDPASSIIQRGMWASQRPRTQNRISTTWLTPQGDVSWQYTLAQKESQIGLRFLSIRGSNN